MSANVLADIILIVHLLFVLFVIGGLAMVWIGARAGWAWVRNFWFRALHLAAILYVAVIAVLDLPCPLTVWEDALRGYRADSAGFIERWIHALLFYDLPAWVFTSAYTLFALMVLISIWAVPPKLPRRKPHA